MLYKIRSGRLSIKLKLKLMAEGWVVAITLWALLGEALIRRKEGWGEDSHLLVIK